MSEPPSAPAPIALVTGGAERIGRAIVLALARAGFSVAIHARHASPNAERLARAVRDSGADAALVTGDLMQPEALAALIPAARAALGPITLLVNNAAMFERDEIGALDRALWDRQLAVNLTAPVFLADAFATQVGGGDPAIVNVLDQRVLKPTPHFVSYALSKSALHTATVMLAQALAPRIRVNAVAPGPTLPSPRQTASQFAAQAAAVPLGRGPTPEEIADAIVFLAKARSMTGQTLAVDGGQHLAWRTRDAEGVE